MPGSEVTSLTAGPGGGGGGDRCLSGIYESAAFPNYLIEFETDNREMAVDVPDSFIAQTKTPPKYPPPSSLGDREEARSSGSSFSALSLSNGHSLHRGRSRQSPPELVTLPSRDHLRIEKDGRLINTMEPPPLPTPQQSERIKKYGEDIARRTAEQERKAAQNEFLRHSIRNSQKMRALKENGAKKAMAEGKSNFAFKTGDEGEEIDMTPLNQTSIDNLAATVERLAANPNLQNLASRDVSTREAIKSLRSLFNDQRFQRSYQFAQKIESALVTAKTNAYPITGEAQESAEETLSVLAKMDGEEDPDAAELAKILTKPWLDGLLAAHDHISAFKSDTSHHQVINAETALMERLTHYSEPNIKIVHIEKVSDQPLGATIRNNEVNSEVVEIARIIRGGTADATGLLHVGDEILEVNETELRGKNVNEVYDILGNMQGTLTFLVVPTRQHHVSPGATYPGGHTAPQNGTPTTASGRHGVVHLKAHIDYDPEEDPFVPCRDLGISFIKGDILHVINQQDANWWQARRDGEDDQTLAGLIPSSTFLAQREAMKHTIAHDSDRYDGGGGGRSSSFGGSNARGFQRAKSGLLCAKKSGRGKKNRRKLPFADEEGDAEEILTYEEVALYYPRADRKRPVVLIGPPNIGRHELRQRLMQDAEQFAAAIPHTSRPKRADEVDGQDYHFISRLQFESDILARRFVEHGEYEKSYYGTSLEAIRSVVSEKICVLNLHPQSLKILKSSDLMPYVVFVTPPNLEKLKRWKIDHSEPINDNELREIMERGREMEETYGHYFDMVITYSDPERAYQQLLSAITSLEREPQWVPAMWLLDKNNTM